MPIGQNSVVIEFSDCAKVYQNIQSSYDWCFPCSERTPERYPYSFDAHYIWRNKDMEGASGEYTDRMWEWDGDKMRVAMSKRKEKGSIRSISKSDCQRVVKSYYGNNYECVAYGLCCNVSTGYEIGIFFIRKIVKSSSK